MMREGWVEVELGELLDYAQPTKYIVKNTDYNESYKIPVLTPGKSFIKGYTNETDGIFSELPVIIFDDFTTASRYVNFQFKVKSSAMKILTPISEHVNVKLTYYLMQVLEERSDTHKRYWISIYSKKTIPLAPVPEQRAIVAKIDKLFSDLDNGIANLKTAKAKLDIYRQAVLKKAFEGELTKTSSVSIDMKVVNLGSLIEKPKYGTSKKCWPEPKGTPVLRIPNIGEDTISHDDLKYARFDNKEAENLMLKEGDLLTIRSNGSVDLVGKCALIKKSDTHCLYAGYLIRLRPISEKIDSKFLLYCLSSHALRVQIESKAKSTSGVNNINSGELESLQLPICSLEEQIAIVTAIESRLSVCDKLTESIDQSLKKAEALRQSILKKALEGKLLSQAELEACRREPDWEPADKLLERIKRDKAVGAKNATTGKRSGL